MCEVKWKSDSSSSFAAVAPIHFILLIISSVDGCRLSHMQKSRFGGELITSAENVRHLKTRNSNECVCCEMVLCGNRSEI